MANHPKISDAVANAMLDTLTTPLAGGLITVYEGSQPATPETAIGASVAKATCTLGTPAFGAAAAHVLTAAAITDDVATLAGTANWFRVWDAAGTTAYMDGEVGTSGCDMNLNSTALSAGGTLHLSAFTVTLPVA